MPEVVVTVRTRIFADDGSLLLDTEAPFQPSVPSQPPMVATTLPQPVPIDREAFLRPEAGVVKETPKPLPPLGGEDWNFGTNPELAAVMPEVVETSRSRDWSPSPHPDPNSVPRPGSNPDAVKKALESAASVRPTRPQSMSALSETNGMPAAQSEDPMLMG